MTEQTKILPDEENVTEANIGPEDGYISDGRGGFWFAFLDIAVMQDREVSFHARGVYALLATYANAKNGRSWQLKIDTIAEVAGISRRRVQYALKELADRGYISITPVYREGRRKASVYTLIGHDAQAVREREFTEETACPNIERNICTPENIECTTCTPKGACGARRIREQESLKQKDVPPITPHGAKPEAKEKKDSGSSAYTPEFEEFWKAYPNTRCSKQKAFRAWQDVLSGRKRASPAAVEELVRAAKIYARECREECREQRYILHASTFLGPDEHWRVYLQARRGEATGLNIPRKEVDIKLFTAPDGTVDMIAYERARRGLD